MKKTSLLLFVFLLSGMGLMAQVTYEYAYDQAGNRIRRSVIGLPRGDKNGNDEGKTMSFTDELPNGSRITLYPNPTKGVIRFDFEMEQPDNNLGYYKLFDQRGALLAEGNCESSGFELDLSRWPQGVYLIEFRSKNLVYTNKIIKE